MYKNSKSREISVDVEKKRPEPPQEFRVTNFALNNSFEIEVFHKTSFFSKERILIEFKWIFSILQLVGINGMNYSRSKDPCPIKKKKGWNIKIGLFSCCQSWWKYLVFCNLCIKIFSNIRINQFSRDKMNEITMCSIQYC
ncbi:hypothetical protein TNIN_103391 [Trichonephila inaurata madagascariensis]|uniref:Uncharacterized protein n=1 Tax=Trichonephila inaurata madagascariensis TaxID=2747483 RepID=A0A8X7BQN0_9ARAC|nr:hypothetical protein TNIN_103391 [Trichonephila inaurata madagascariensis]